MIQKANENQVQNTVHDDIAVTLNLPPANALITDLTVIRRIKSIGISPAYEFVWICPSPNGHIQATESTRADESSIATIRNGANSGTRASTSTSCSTRRRFPRCARAWHPT